MATGGNTENQVVASSTSSQRGGPFGPNQTLILNQQNIKVENCQNVQFGANSVINQTFNSASFSDDSDEDNHKFPTIGDAKLEELKRCNRPVEESEIGKLSEALGVKWKRFVRNLGVKDHDIEAVVENYGRSGKEEVIYQVLCQWKKEKGDDGTVMELIRALEECGLLEHCSCFNADEQ